MSKQKNKTTQDKESCNQRGTLDLIRLLPNMLTLSAICAGLTAIRYGLDERWMLSVILLVIAAFLDGVDGGVARLLDASSKFGAQLDSLADFISFGVAPVFLLYLWHAHEAKGMGWAMVLFFAICTAIRLARFNTTLESDLPKPSWSKHFFAGIPSPAGALLALGPIIISLVVKDDYPTLYQYITFIENPYFLCGYAATIALLMASRVPTFSFKRIRIQRRFASFFMALGGVFVIATISEPLITLLVVGVAYLGSIPCSILLHARLNSLESAAQSK